MFKLLDPNNIDSEYGIVDPWDYVTSFENVLKGYCGYKYAIACDSNTNAIRLCLEYLKIKDSTITIPSNTYISVPNQIVNSGNRVDFEYIEWEGEYPIGETGIIDSACKLEKGDFREREEYKVLSFHHRKIINIGRGGLILTNDENFEKWARPMIYDGRNKNTLYSNDEFVCFGWHMYMTPEDAKRGLEIIHSGVIKSERIIKETHNSYKDLRLEKLFYKSYNSVKILKKWDFNYYYMNIKEIISKTDENIIVLILPQEYALYQEIGPFLEIDVLLKKLNKTLIYFTGSEIDPEINKNFKRFKIITWDSIDYFIKNFQNIEIFNFKKSTIKTKLFSTMVYVKKGREWRHGAVENLFEEGIINHTKTCIRIDDHTKLNGYKYIDKIEPIWDYTTDIPYGSDLTNNLDTHLLPEEYKEGVIDIVFETRVDVFFPTEKTIRPIMAKMGFLVFSCRGYHKKLSEKYGFKLMDNIIDYSFDDIEDNKTRFSLMCKELRKLYETYTIDQIVQSIKDIVDFNHDILIKMRRIAPNDVPNHIYEELIDHKSDEIKVLNQWEV